MTRDQDQSGNLSSYLASIMSERSKQEADAKRLEEQAEAVKLAAFIQDTLPLRNHLKRLSVLGDELLEYFNVTGLLEEVKVTQSFQGGQIEAQVPDDYKLVVDDPQQGVDSFPLERQDGLLRISRLDGYGLKLVKGYDSVARVGRYRQVSRIVGSGGDSGSIYNTYRNDEVKRGEVSMPVRITYEMSVLWGQDPVSKVDGLGYLFTRASDKKPGVNYSSMERNFYQHGESVSAPRLQVAELGSGFVARGASPEALKTLIGDNLVALSDAGRIRL